MSRTDKDKPWWVRTEWYTPEHRCRLRIPAITRWRESECDLAPEPFWSRQERHRWLRPSEPGCTWEPEWPRRYRYNFTRPPTRVDKHLGWWGPDRRDVRDLMIKARKQYRGYREVEILEPVRHHRHAAKAGWWD
jgi:hypothetical protein